MRYKYEKRILLMATFAFLMDKQYKSANLKREGIKFYYFMPSIFF